MKKCGRKTISLNSRDLAILHFVWRWKLSTTHAIHDRFFSNAIVKRAYNRLQELKRAGYLECLPISGRTGMAWGLSDKGFRTLIPQLPSLTESGFRSESPEHDLIVSAVHLGDWLVQTPPHVEFLSEQELRRFDRDHFPSWVPQSQLHRPDGYWQVPYQDRFLTIALEVELNQKKNSFYQVVGRFYSDHPSITRVLWCVKSLSTAKTIRRHIESDVKDRALIHDFVSLSQVESLGWNAPILIGRESGKSIAYLLGASIPPVNSPGTFTAKSLFDTRKCPREAATSSITFPTKIPNRLYPSAPSLSIPASNEPFFIQHPANVSPKPNQVEVEVR